MTPEEWLAGFESKIADVREKAEEFRASGGKIYQEA